MRLQSDVNNPNSAKVVASIPACQLVASDFHEIMKVHVDQYGHIRGIWYQTMATECPSTKLSVPKGPVQMVRTALHSPARDTRFFATRPRSSRAAVRHRAYPLVCFSACTANLT